MYCLKIRYSCFFIQNNTFVAGLYFFLIHYFQAWNLRAYGRRDASYFDHSRAFCKEGVYMRIGITYRTKVCPVYALPTLSVGNTKEIIFDAR
jgi:hypothetical protein